MSYEYSRSPFALALGVTDAGAKTSFQLDSAFTYETSGDVWFARFVAPVSQSAATLTLYAYCTATTGSPTIAMGVYNGPAVADDPDRPEAGGSDLVSGATPVSPTANTWCSFAETVSLTVGQTYYLVLYNTHATPASNHASFAYRGDIDTFAGVPTSRILTAGYSADGFTTDPTVAVTIAPCVIKFSDGSLLGNPYVDSAAHANNQNDRGVRIQFTEDIVVSGGWIYGASGSLSGMEINKASDGSNIMSCTMDRYGQQRSQICRWPPVTLSGGVSYDFVLTLSGSTTIGTVYNMGEAEGSLPADVLACRPQEWAHVTGSQDPVATPYTVDTSKIMLFALLIDNNPAIAGGSGGVIGGPNLRGGRQL